MKIRKIDKKDIPALIAFNRSMYPERDKLDESIYFRFFKNPLSYKNSESIIAVNGRGEIVGQYFLMPARFRYHDNEAIVHWGMDYIVEQKERRSLAGIILCREALKVKFHFGLGVNETALSIHKRFGDEVIGNFNKYIKIINPFSIHNVLSTSFMYNLSYKFPEVVDTKYSRFERVHDAGEIISNSGYWEKTSLEFSRDVDFIAWRFFYYPNKYIVYKYVSGMEKENSDISTSYFIVRPILWKKINCLLLVDYRFSSDGHFNEILKAVTKLARTQKMSAILTGCSMPSLMKILSSNYFFRFSGVVIISNYKKLNNNCRIDNDNILVTYGDSDADFWKGDNTW